MDTRSHEDRRADLELLANSRVYFGHQSVGFNLLDGLTDLANSERVDNLNIVESRQVEPGDSPGFFHARIGENTRPKSKIDAFATDIRSMQGAPDVALLKLCYVDFNPDTDVGNLFTYYKDNIEALKQERPEITFVHTTVPLTTNVRRIGGIKGRILSLLGRNDVVDATLLDSNIKRQEYNEMLFSAFPEDPVFDISRAESTRQDGTRVTFVRGAQEYFSLVPEYTYDGGHLNEVGRRWIAAEMVHVIADILQRKDSEQSN